MALSNTNRVKTHTGNGATTVFPYDFYIPDAASIEVSIYDSTDETTTVLSSSLYSVTGLGDPAFGSVTYPLSGDPLAATEKIIIKRTVAYTQTLDIGNQSGFNADELEAALDRVVMQLQQLAEEMGRTVKGLAGETFDDLQAASERANKYMVFDASGNPAASETSPSLDDAVTAAAASAAAASTSAQAAITAQLAAEAAGSGIVFPVGIILDYGGTAAPTGWLFCYGQAISRTTYSDLFTAIGTAFGTGDGSTTFNVPDYRGRVGVGKDDMGGAAAGRVTTAGSSVDGVTLGAVGGAQNHVLTTTQMPAHTHTGTAASDGAHTHTGTAASNGAHTHTVPLSPNEGIGSNLTISPLADPNGSQTVTTASNGAHTHTLTIDSGGAHTHTLTINSAGSDGAHLNMQPSLIVNKIIRTGV